MSRTTPKRIGVVITTYNSPEWLEKVLIGYEAQTDQDFQVLIADDGSGSETKALIDRYIADSNLNIEHVWHEDEGFRKTIILNKVIALTQCDYLIFTDGDCVPRADFVAVHRNKATSGYFLSGGYIKLSMHVSNSIDQLSISNQSVFDHSNLIKLGQPRSIKLWKLVRTPWLQILLETVTPTKATWNGMNSSAWVDDIKAVNGFDERMQYGGLDRELGERLWNSGIKSKQIRYSAICLHLDHPRGYSRPEVWEKNYQIRKDVKANKSAWTQHGIIKT